MTTGNRRRAKAETVTLCSTCESLDLVCQKALDTERAEYSTETYRKNTHIVQLVQEQGLMFPPDLALWGEELWKVSDPTRHGGGSPTYTKAVG